MSSKPELGMILKQGGVSHCGLAIHIKKKSILRQKKNYGNSKYFTMQKI